MKKEKIVVVGVNHAGTSFIRTLAMLNPKAEINAYDRNDNISFLGCGIALWVGGEFKDPSGLFYSDKEKLTNIYKANVKMEHDVTEINVKEKYVMVKDLNTGEVQKDTFDKLVFSGGTWPIKLTVEGADLNNIFFSKIFQHAKKIKAKAKSKKVNDVVIIGAGYIGIELVEAFHHAGKKVTLIDMADRVVPRYFDTEFTTPMMKEMAKQKIKLAMEQKTIQFLGDKKGNVTHVVTDKGKYKADVVISAVGFLPQTQSLWVTDKEGKMQRNKNGSVKGQVKLDPRGAIIVNQYQQTSNKDVYAIGDCSNIKHHQLGSANVALATNAVKTGIAAAMHIAKGKNAVKFPGVNGTNAISVFDFHYSSTGVSEASAKAFGIKHEVAYLEDWDRPEFMKNKAKVSFKIVYDPETLKLLGAQIGSRYQSHTEVMYAFSLALSKGMTLPEIALMDVYFLPHFNKPFNFMLRTIMRALGLDYTDYEAGFTKDGTKIAN